MASLKDALAPTLLVAGAVFATFATPLVFVGERQVTIRMDRDVVYDGIVRDVSLPYIAFSLVVSMGAGLTTMTVAGWSSSTKRNIALENEREALRAEIHEKEIQIDELKLSSANLAAAGLDAFLDAAEATPQAPEVMAEMLADDPFITIEPVVATPTVTPPPPSRKGAASPRVEYVQPVVEAEAIPATPPIISGEVLHVYNALQDRFEQAATESHERSTANSRAYTPSPDAAAASTPSEPQLNPAVAGIYTALYDRLQAIDLPSPQERGVATSRAYVLEELLSSNPTHLQVDAPHTYAPISSQFAASEASQQAPLVQPQPTPPQPTLIQPTPAIAQQPQPKPARPAADEAHQAAAAAYAILGLEVAPQSPVAVDTELEELSVMQVTDELHEISTPPTQAGLQAQTTADCTSMPWDHWLEATSIPSDIEAPAVPTALAKLEEWLSPVSSNSGDRSVLSDWDRWLQQQEQPQAKRPQSRNNLDDWLAAFNMADNDENDADLFDLPSAAPDVRMPKVVRFQRGAAHSRKDS